MITERKLVCGTKSELEEYYSYVGTGGTKEISSGSIKQQINTIKESNRSIGYIVYLKENIVNGVMDGYKTVMDAIQVRDDE